MNHIIHAGDIGKEEIIGQLKDISMLTAIRGNIDKTGWAQQFHETEVLEIAGRYIYILHDLQSIELDPEAAGFDIVVSGHSHIPKLYAKHEVIYLNPGSAGPRRFSLPISIAKIFLIEDHLSVEIYYLSSFR